jgi:hypothetical protein
MVQTKESISYIKEVKNPNILVSIAAVKQIPIGT